MESSQTLSWVSHANIKGNHIHSNQYLASTFPLVTKNQNAGIQFYSVFVDALFLCIWPPPLGVSICTFVPVKQIRDNYGSL
jgi:hypothetical protein